MKKVAIIAAVVVLVAGVSLVTWKSRGPEHPDKLLITLPSGEVVEAIRAPRMKTAEKKKILNASIEGKIEIVAAGEIQNDPSHRLVMITNEGEMIMLVNPDIINKIRFGDYIGHIVTLDGYWDGHLDFKGKSYRSLWIEQVKRK